MTPILSVAVPTAAPVVVTGADFGFPYDVVNTVPMSVEAKPGADGTLKVETRMHADGDWTPWVKGTEGVVDETESALLHGPVQAFRLTAATAEGTVFFARPFLPADLRVL
jgi:hypothetical protein